MKKKKEEDENPFAFLDEEDEPVVPRKRGKWPEQAPILLEDDLCWNMSMIDGRMDLQEWLIATFDPDGFTYRSYDKAHRTLRQVICERLSRRFKHIWYFLEMTGKKREPSLEWQAAAWNEMLVRLGYEVSKKLCRDPGAT